MQKICFKKDLDKVYSVTVEVYFEDNFAKKNPGKACDKRASSEKAQCLAQVNYEKSNHK